MVLGSTSHSGTHDEHTNVMIMRKKTSSRALAASVRDTIVSPRRWALSAQSARVVAYSLGIEAVALVLTGYLLATTPPRVGAVVMLGVLIAMAVLQAELNRQVERTRRRVSGMAHINMTSVWIFAGVLLLPAAFAAVLTMVLYLHLALRSWYRLHRVPAWRTISNTSILVMTCYASKSVLVGTGVEDIHVAIARGWAGAAAVVAALLTHFVVNAILVLPARARPGRTLTELFGGWADNGLEVATLCLAVLNALALATLPGLALLVLPPLLILQRAALVKQLEQAAIRDDKTGLLNTTGWHELAERTLIEAEQVRATFGLLMIDLDHFKRINDTYGHLAGDTVLRKVADTITSAVRGHNDAVGRFGGEEFVVLLPDVATQHDVGAIAERIRHAITTLAVDVGEQPAVQTITGLSASIGAAMYPSAGTAVQRLIDAADTALYHAKDNGRNRIVHIADLA
jgi:diguanylate cyclase (GGDEF)-like protein